MVQVIYHCNEIKVNYGAAVFPLFVQQWWTDRENNHHNYRLFRLLKNKNVFSKSEIQNTQEMLQFPHFKYQNTSSWEHTGSESRNTCETEGNLTPNHHGQVRGHRLGRNKHQTPNFFLKVFFGLKDYFIENVFCIYIYIFYIRNWVQHV